MDDEGWVTGDALFTVKVLGAIQPGDEVKLDLMSVDDYGIIREDHGKVVRINALGCKGDRNDPNGRYSDVQTYRGAVVGEPNHRTDWWLTDIQIGAWRPKQGT